MNTKKLVILKYVAYAIGALIAIYLIIAVVRKVREQLEAGVDGIGKAIGNVFTNFSPLGLLSELGSDLKSWRQSIFGGGSEELPDGITDNGDGSYTATSPGGASIVIGDYKPGVDYTNTDNWHLQ